MKAGLLKEKETAQNSKRKRIRDEAPLIQAFYDNKFTAEDPNGAFWFGKNQTKPQLELLCEKLKLQEPFKALFGKHFKKSLRDELADYIISQLNLLNV